MRLARYCFLFSALCLAAVPSYAQWPVFDASNFAEAVNEFEQLQQMYTTANQTRDQIIQAYNLAHYMSQMPQDMYQRYKAQFALWTNLNAPNTYGNTVRLDCSTEHRHPTTIIGWIRRRCRPGQSLSCVGFRTTRPCNSSDNRESICDFRLGAGHHNQRPDHSWPNTLPLRISQSTDLQPRS